MNNKYDGCPALMADGRAFTDYRSSNLINETIRAQNNLGNSHDYREFLTNNALQLMHINGKITANECSCSHYTKTPTLIETASDVNSLEPIQPYDRMASTHKTI